MPESEFYNWWYLGYGLGVAVVLIVAVLLVAILLVARNIERLAGTALKVAGDIEARTTPVWSLADANAITEDIVRTVRSIEARAAALADALEGRR